MHRFSPLLLFCLDGERTLGIHVGDNDENSQKGQPAATSSDEAAGAKTDLSSDLHIVFSTSCNKFQHWQSEVLLNRAKKVNQKGSITHIVVGCEESEAKGMEGKDRTITHPPGAGDALVEQSVWKKSSNSNVNIHFAPAIPEAKEFPWFNKPWSFYHWSKEVKPKESVIAIIDPDEFFLQGLTQGVNQGANLTNSWPSFMQQEVTDVAKPGMAVAQMYGFGDSWLHKFDREKICGKNNYCSDIKSDEAANFYAVGPPMMIHKDNFPPVMDKWWEFMKPTYAQDKGDILADMYAYNMATSYLQVKHVRLEQYMVSNSGATGEGWDMIDSLNEMSCRKPPTADTMKLPTFIHLASSYELCTGGSKPDERGDCPEGEDFWKFHKGHVPANIMECGASLLEDPPEDLFNRQTTKELKRDAFVLCNAYKFINEAAVEFKQKNCQPDIINTEKCVRLTKSGGGEFPLAKRTCGKEIKLLSSMLER